MRYVDYFNVFLLTGSCGGVASLVLVVQTALRPQRLAAGGDEADPMFELLWELWTLDLQNNNQTGSSVGLENLEEFEL